MKKTQAQPFRLPIAGKLLFGCLSCGILTVIISVIALPTLQQLNEINKGKIYAPKRRDY